MHVQLSPLSPVLMNFRPPLSLPLACSTPLQDVLVSATSSAQIVQRQCRRRQLINPRPACLPETIQEAATGLGAGGRLLTTRLLQLSQAPLEVAVRTSVPAVGRHVASFAEGVERRHGRRIPAENALHVGLAVCPHRRPHSSTIFGT